ncbi:V-type ATPase subunit, partial [Candidatus Woesearchaeota archaeon]|nr:V-type ATPase subunit [Candidatus Woesearchaeota archaeon]
MAQLNVSSNPYTFVRVSVMKSRLLRKEDYDRLLKMSVPEITGFLGQTEYKKEIDELAMRHSGSELVELALNKNLVSTFRKLLRISDDNLNEFISVFFKRNDIWNLSLVLRAKFSGMNPEEVRDMFLPVGQFPQEELEAMLEKSIEDIVSGLARKGLLSQSGETSQAALENSLTGNYYQSVAEFTRNIKAEGHLFLRFLQEEIAILNLVTIFKMKRDKVPSDQI